VDLLPAVARGSLLFRDRHEFRPTPDFRVRQCDVNTDQLGRMGDCLALSSTELAEGFSFQGKPNEAG